MTLLTLFIILHGYPKDTIKIRHDSWVAKDKALHFSISFIAYSGFEALFKGRGVQEPENKAIYLTIGLGIAKEIYDKFVKKTYFSWRDLISDIAGLTLAFSIH